MADPVSKPGWREAGLINPNDGAEVEYWMKVLGCTRDELVEAVKKAGISADAVRKHLLMNRIV